MTDRELLELAAKAVGIEKPHYEDGPWLEIRYGLTEAIWGDDLDGYWNPLESDRDAFRLMVKLGITKTLDLELGPGGALVTIHHPEVFADEYNEPKQPEFDAVAATRRAIVRAAADVARAQAA